jgi:hypothetical protein
LISLLSAILASHLLSGPTRNMLGYSPGMATVEEICDRLSKAGFLDVHNNALVHALREKRYRVAERKFTGSYGRVC